MLYLRFLDRARAQASAILAYPQAYTPSVVALAQRVRRQHGA